MNIRVFQVVEIFSRRFVKPIKKKLLLHPILTRANPNCERTEKADTGGQAH